LPPGLLGEQEYKGSAVHAFYTTRLPLGDAGSSIQPGMSGQAKIFGRRRSVAERLATILGNVVHTHFW
jgi:ApbE superfamily uncharacterized protein (UPF0280 family)